MDAIPVTGPSSGLPGPPPPPAPVRGFADVFAAASVPATVGAGPAHAGVDRPHTTAAVAATTARLTLGRMLGVASAPIHPTPVLVPAGAPASGVQVAGGGVPDRVRALGPLVVPVSGRRTSGFGPRVHPITGRHQHHAGVDVAAPSGTPVAAAAAGTVVRAGSAGGYGLLVEVDHGQGVVTRYAHLSATDVAPGQRVAAGAQLGAVGSTGRSTGPHLHLELRVDGEPVDPQGLLVA